MATGEERLAWTLAEVAETLVDDFDLVELLALLVERSVALLGASAGGIVLADEHGALRLMAASSEAMELVELFQVQNVEGPCLDCYRTGAAVIADDLSEATERWPIFVPFSSYNGFEAAHAFPLRLQRRVLGVLNIFRVTTGPLVPAHLLAAQALADVGAIAIVQFRAMSQAQLLSDQLRGALDSRVVIEQAKGILAERAGVGMDEAFSSLRRYARGQGRLLAEVAAQVVAGALGPQELLVPRNSSRRPEAGDARSG